MLAHNAPRFLHSEGRSARSAATGVMMIETAEPTGNNAFPKGLTMSNDDGERPPQHRRASALRRAAVLLIPVVAVVAAAYAILRPNITICSEPATRVRCASNLRQVGQALAIYCRDHGGVLPPTFDEVLSHGDIGPAVFICPATSDEPAEGNNARQWLKEFGKPGHNSYVYVIGSVPETRLTPAHILAHEPLQNHTDGMNVLYGDYHVDWVPKRDAAYLLAEIQAGFNPPRPPATQPTAGP
jgi:hypothetical protein